MQSLKEERGRLWKERLVKVDVDLSQFKRYVLGESAGILQANSNVNWWSE
jgi:hypothetical protein